MSNAGGTILIVEDNLDDQFFIERALRQSGLRNSTHFAASGNEAIAYLNGSANDHPGETPHPSFVITDIDMADGDGFSVLLELQRAPRSDDLRVLILSDFADADHVRKAYAMGATAYCLKPWDPRNLRSMLVKFLTQQLTRADCCARPVEQRMLPV